jgi:hypothetical protein
MDSLNLFESVRRRLAARGVAAAYADRLIEELELHFYAAVEGHLLGGCREEDARVAALRQLGSEQEIVRTTLDSLRRERFVGRHRVLCMILAPMVLEPLTQILVAMLLFSIFRRVEYARWLWRLGIELDGRIMFIGVEILCNLAVPLVFVSGLWRLGHQRFCGRAYTLAGCGLLMICSLYIQLRSFPAGQKPPPPWWTLTPYQEILLGIYGVLLIQWLVRGNQDSKKQPAIR